MCMRRRCTAAESVGGLQGHQRAALVGNGRLRRLLIVLMLADTGATSRAMAQKNT